MGGSILTVDFDFGESWTRASDDGVPENLAELSRVLKAACVSAETALYILEEVPIEDMLANAGTVAFEMWEPAGELWDTMMEFLEPIYGSIAGDDAIEFAELV
jgi:hypothetical protein